MKRKKSQEYPIGAIFIAPVLARQANLSNLLSSVLLTFLSDPWPPNHGAVSQYGSIHRDVDPVYNSRFWTPDFTKCAHTGPKPFRPYSSYFSAVFSMSIPCPE